MKILHLSAVKNWGGGENQIEMLCRELNAENLIFCAEGGEFHKQLKNTKLNFITAPLKFKVDPRFVFKLLNVCKKERPDLIHIHDSTALMLAIIADKFGKLPDFIFSKKTSFPIKPRRQTLYKYNYHKIKRILCVSEETKKITSESIIDQQKLVRIYHGIELKKHQNLKPEFNLRERLKISSDRKIIGNIANHIRAKNLETLVATANRLINIENRTEFHFVQIGSFTKRTLALKELVNEAGLNDYFSFLDFQKSASGFIPQFEISLLTSQSEGIPQFIYESFYHKVPVISTNVGGIPEIIIHNENGLLAEAHDDKKLCENIVFLMDNRALIPKFAEISYQKLIQGFTSEIMAENTLQAYKNVLNGRL